MKQNFHMELHGKPLLETVDDETVVPKRVTWNS